MNKRYMTCAETAKLIRGALKAAHPGTRFSVRSDTYAGGASIRVRWTDGPTRDAVEKTARMYEGASFDGMIDLKSYHDSVLVGPDGTPEVVHFGADFVFTDREESDAFVQSLYPRVTHNGHDSYAAQCGSCGHWRPADSAWWVAHALPTGRDFCCSQACAARLLARYTDASSVRA